MIWIGIVSLLFSFNFVRTHAFQRGAKYPTFRLVHLGIGGAGQDAPPTVSCVSPICLKNRNCEIVSDRSVPTLQVPVDLRNLDLIRRILDVLGDANFQPTGELNDSILAEQL